MRETLYIACEEVNFIWTISEVQEFDRLWREELIVDVRELSKRLERPLHDVAFLIWDRANSGYIGTMGVPGPRSTGGRPKKAKDKKPRAKKGAAKRENVRSLLPRETLRPADEHECDEKSKRSPIRD